MDINRQVLESLESKKLEFSILEASTLSDVRVIDRAYDDGQISPIILNTFIMFMFLATMANGLYLSYRSIFAKLLYPSDIQDLYADMRIAGVLPFKEKDIDSVAINSLIANLTFLSSSDRKIFMVSGPLTGVGKSTVSNYLASGLNNNGLKVALIDCDYHRGDLHKEIKSKNIKLEDLSVDKFDISDYLVKEGFFFIPRPRNASETAFNFFQSQEFSLLIDKIYESVDYIIIDTPPLLSRPDALMISRVSSEILLVARHAVTTNKEFKESMNQLNSVTNKSIYAVYNCLKRNRFNYGYYNYYDYKYYSSDYRYENNE